MKGQCLECNYKTEDKNINSFICNKCEEKNKKPINKWFILICIIITVLLINYYELQTVTLIIGISIGLMININFNRKKTK